MNQAESPECRDSSAGVISASRLRDLLRRSNVPSIELLVRWYPGNRHTSFYRRSATLNRKTEMDQSSPINVTRRELLVVAATSAAATAMPSSLAQSSEATPSALTEVSLDVNGKAVKLQLDTRTTLLDAVREHLHLTGTKKGCDHGQCGACTRHRGRATDQFLSHAGRHAPRCERHDDRGAGHAHQPASDAGRVRQTRRLPVRLLHARADLFRRGGARGDQGRHPQPCERRPDRAFASDRRRDARAHERQHLPLRSLLEHRRGHGRSRRSDNA
jgi:hypothetical protein